MWLDGRLKKMVERKTITFSEVAEQWLKLKKNSVKISTYSKYSYTVNKYIIPKFNKISLSNMKNYDFNQFISELEERQNLSEKTIKDIMCVLKAIACYAEEEYDIIFKKKKVIEPKIKTNPLIILSRREQGKLERRCLRENTLPSLGIIIAMNTGLRIGEICGLKWKDIDLEKRILYVRRTLQRIYDIEHKTTRIIIDTPKTQNSVRNIPISNKLYELLLPFKGKYSENSFFLTGDEYIYIEPRRMQYIFKDILQKSDIRMYKFHILRHTFATHCIEVGMDPKSLSEILGHATVDITLNRYVHSSYKTKKKFLERL